jgi:3-dehydroquinate synthase
MDHISNAGDPFEKGSSRPLDFGHWAAHKLEQLDNFKIRHGEAVAIGIAIDSIYSFKQGWISIQDLSRILRLLLKAGFDLNHPLLNSKDTEGNYQLLEGIKEFREHLGGKLTVAFLSDIGKKVDKNKIDFSIMKSSIDYLVALYNDEN